MSCHRRWEAAVEGFLSRIDARKRWSLSLSAAVLPQSNPVKRTGREQVRIGGVPFRLNPDARASSGVGYLVTTGASFSPVLAADLRGVFAVSSAAKLYKQPDWNDVSLHGETGLARLFDGGTLSGGLRLGRRWLAADPYNREAGPWMRGRVRLSPGHRLELNLSAMHRDHDGQDARNGWRFSAKPAWTYTPRATTSIETDLDLETAGARERHHAYRTAGLGITLSHAFRGGLSISPSVSAQLRRHAGPDPLFSKTRTDRQFRLAVKILHRALRYQGFAPYAGYSLEWNRSNIPLNTYRNHGAVLGISKTF